MSDRVDVFAENITLIDWEIFELWIKGLSVNEACMTLMKDHGLLQQYPGVTQELLMSDLNNQYRLFGRLEHVLLTAGDFSQQNLYQVIKLINHN